MSLIAFLQAAPGTGQTRFDGGGARNIAGGVSRLPEAMAAALGDAVLSNKIVSQIDMSGNGVEVRCLDGSRFSSDFVISAVPFSLLRKIDVTPGLVGAQGIGVRHMRYANTTRAFLRIKRPFWDNDELDPSFFSDGPIEMFWVLDNHGSGDDYKGMIVTTGNQASRLDDLDPAQVPEFLLAELNRMRPASRGHVEILTWHSWAATPLIRGCRHMFAPGQVTQFAHEMIHPWKRLHFAGEHTRRIDFGMESALESGERSAIEVLARLS